ncbi:MAG: hypothetical protein OXD32_03205 [Endozoicomonadaceae bacterium]|nr:hypothetical protein [Endozoicomonadaceae bacterium]MCY4328950.1 hypothetical protein [Endozoicomonadaceae bacterium]
MNAIIVLYRKSALKNTISAPGSADVLSFFVKAEQYDKTSTDPKKTNSSITANKVCFCCKLLILKVKKYQHSRLYCKLFKNPIATTHKNDYFCFSLKLAVFISRKKHVSETGTEKLNG